MSIFKRLDEESIWIPDANGHYEFTWYQIDFQVKLRMPFIHRIVMAWRLLIRGRIDSGKNVRRYPDQGGR